MEDFTREQIFQGIEKAISEDNKEMLKIFVDAGQRLQAKNEEVTTGESLERGLGLTAKYIAEPYEMIYDPISSGLNKIGIGDGKGLSERLPNIYKYKPENPYEQAMSYPTRALSYAASPLMGAKAVQGVTSGLMKQQGLNSVKKPLFNTASTKPIGRFGEAVKEGAKTAFLKNPKEQAAAATAFGLGSSLAVEGGKGTMLEAIPEIGREIAGGLAGALLKKPIVSGTKDLYSRAKSINNDESTTIFKNRVNTKIDNALGTGTKLEDFPPYVQEKIRDMVIKATSQNKNISPTALQKMIDYEISGAVPTIGRITSNQKMQNLEKKETNYNADLTQQPQKNTELLIQKIDDMGAANAVEPSQYGVNLAKTLDDDIEAVRNQFNNRYKAIANTKEGRGILFDHVYFTNKVADRLEKTFRQFDVPEATQKLINSFATGVNTLNLASREQLKRNLGEKIAGSKGGEKAAYKEIRNVLDETPLLKNQRMIETKKGKDLRQELDNIRIDYKNWIRGIQNDKLRNSVYKWGSVGEIPANWFSNNVLNRNPKEFKQFYDSLTKKQKMDFKDNYLGEIKQKIMSGDNINTNALDRILNSPKKLSAVFSPDEIQTLKSIRNVAKYEKNIKGRNAIERSFAPEQSKIKSIVNTFNPLKTLLPKNNFYNVEKGLLFPDTNKSTIPAMPLYESLLGNN